MGLCFMITGQPSNQNYGFNKAIRLLHVFKENKIKYIYIYTNLLMKNVSNNYFCFLAYLNERARSN
jgi:hypothetical protein